MTCISKYVTMLQQDSCKPDSEFLADSAITAFSLKASERN